MTEMPDTIPNTTDWPAHVSADYARAVVRLATLSHLRVQHLLFGAVELLPAECAALDPPPVEETSAGRVQIVASATPMPVPEALAWYEAGLSGRLIIPGTDVAVQTVPLAAEPGFGTFVVADRAPANAPWHGGVRMSRLVPMGPLPEPVRSFRDETGNPEASNRARRWLAERLHFDVLDADESLGGMVLLAPNPVLRRISESPLEQAPGGPETLRVQAQARDGHGYESLEVTLREERPDGVFLVARRRLNAFGRADFPFPHRASQTGIELHCDERGLLAVQRPAFFLTGVSVEMELVRDQVEVTVPARRKGARSATYTAATSEAVGAVQAGAQPERGASARLAELLELGRVRASRSAAHERVCHRDRAGVVEFLRALIWQGAERVVFVDPYFNEIDVREFALVVPRAGCRVGVLRSGGEGLWAGDAGGGGPAPVHPGQMLFDDLTHVNRIRAARGQTAVDVRLMGDPARVYHDRFLVVDDAVWHPGHSFNQIGQEEVSVVTRLTDGSAVLPWIVEDLARGRSFLEEWPRLLARRHRARGTPPRGDGGEAEREG